MHPEALALFYAALTVPPVLVQIALTFGAPLGRFTMGGRYPQRLPRAIRPVAAVQAAILIACALIVLDHARPFGSSLPTWAIWAPVIIISLSAAMNTVTPSLPERLAWSPATILMSVFAWLLALN